MISGQSAILIRAGLLTQEPGSGMIGVTQGTSNKFGKISRDNVAQSFIEVLENEKTYQKSYTILDGDVPINKAF